MTSLTPEILLNSQQVTHHPYGDRYEFVLNDQLRVVECVKIESLTQGKMCPVPDARCTLAGMLFELHHVRVNPRFNNRFIIAQLMAALTNIGVRISHPPDENTMAICYKPLGEISENVRFYLNEASTLVFLSPTMRPHLVAAQKIHSVRRS